jgi:hypothetical protein
VTLYVVALDRHLAIARWYLPRFRPEREDRDHESRHTVHDAQQPIPGGSVDATEEETL